MRSDDTKRSLCEAFVVGSSGIVTLPFFFIVSVILKKKRFNPYVYMMIAPLFLGLLNVLGKWYQDTWKVTNETRFLVTALIGATCVSTFIVFFRVYRYAHWKDWVSHIFYLYIWYLFIFTGIVPYIHQCIE